MSQVSPGDKPQADELPADILDLAAAVKQLPPDERRKIEPLVTRVLESTKRRRRILGLVQDALGQLRLDMKYLMFDLEATRRERDELSPQGRGSVRPPWFAVAASRWPFLARPARASPAPPFLRLRRRVASRLVVE